MNDFTIKEEIAKSVSRQIIKDFKNSTSDIARVNINKPELKKQFWLGNFQITLKIR